jgi:hypothetical protein
VRLTWIALTLCLCAALDSTHSVSASPVPKPAVRTLIAPPTYCTWAPGGEDVRCDYRSPEVVRDVRAR